MKPNYFLCYLLIVLFSSSTAFAQTYSELWGKNGETWSPESRLPDVSYAGYHHGESPIPDVKATANVKDFGAVGDGSHDDTNAFQDAIAKTNSGSIFIPNGRYVIKGILEITKPNVVLKGESRENTILYCPIPLNEIKPNWGATTSGQKTSNYSWSGGFIVIRGSYESKELATVTQPAKRSDQWISLSTTQNLKPGQWVEVRVQDTKENTLAHSLYSGDPGETEKLNGRTRASIVTRIKTIEGKRIKLERPLRFDIEAQWKPRVLSFNPTVTESGIENITFEYPDTPYKGHFTELGFNMIAMSGVAHCWVRNVRALNPDSGIFVSGKFCTVRDVLIESSRPEDNRNDAGHHGISMSGDDNLCTEFEYRTSFIHGVTVAHSAGNVISNGKGTRLSFDHHKHAPHSNVFTNIHVGDTKDTWRCGGGAALGKHCAGHGTFWNIDGDGEIDYPRENFGPDTMNIVGVPSKQKAIKEMDGKWFDPTPPSEIVPKNIHEAQLKRRLEMKKR